MTNRSRWMKCTINSLERRELRPKGKRASNRQGEEICYLKKSRYKIFRDECIEVRTVLANMMRLLQWLAVTHKSFDHARRGFNDRLAFLGKRIVDLQTSIALLDAPPTPGLSPASPPSEVYNHPALQGLENLTSFAKHQVLEKSRLARLARSYGIDTVVRWKPRKSDNLESSGVDVVLAHTIFSIIGALALQRGGEVAAETVRERVLAPLGVR